VHYTQLGGDVPLGMRRVRIRRDADAHDAVDDVCW
jgi:hypothetical protein